MQSISAFKLARFSWHANDRVYVEFREQPGLDDYLGIIHAEQETILQDDCRTTVSPQTIHDSRHSQPFRCSPNRTENDSSPRLFPNRRMEDSSKLQVPGHLPYNQAHLAGTYYHGIHTGHPNHTATLLSHNSPHFLYYILNDLREGNHGRSICVCPNHPTAPSSQTRTCRHHCPGSPKQSEPPQKHGRLLRQNAS